MLPFIHAYLRDTIAVFETLAADEAVLAEVGKAAAITAERLLNGGKLLAAGNGGSAADAQHLAAEFVGRLVADRPAMRAIALTTDSSILTSVTNDYGYQAVFRRQLEGLADPGDVFFAISTSGTSANILEALRYARAAGIVTIGLTGQNGGAMRQWCDHLIVAPSSVTAHIQEAHLAIEHMFSSLVEKRYMEALEPAARARPVADSILSN